MNDAIDTGDAAGARQARRAIQSIARQALNSLDGAANPGIYMFCDTAGNSGWADLRYIGCTIDKLSKRLMDWFKHDSALDETSYTVAADVMIKRAYARMRCAMTTSEEGLATYCGHHQKAVKAMVGDSVFLAPLPGVSPVTINMIESTLIATAWVSGAPLVNAEARRLPDPEQREAVVKDARRVLEGWRQLGLGSALSSQFEDALL